jgi:hypothetical protein
LAGMRAVDLRAVVALLCGTLTTLRRLPANSSDLAFIDELNCDV